MCGWWLVGAVVVLLPVAIVVEEVGFVAIVGEGVVEIIVEAIVTMWQQ